MPNEMNQDHEIRSHLFPPASKTPERKNPSCKTPGCKNPGS